MNGITHVNKFLVTIVNGLRLVIMNDLSVFSYRGDIMNVTCNFKTYIYIKVYIYITIVNGYPHAIVNG